MEWLLFLTLAGFLPLALITAGCCCGFCVRVCGTPPAQMQVVITGITAGTCDKCDELNATYILPRLPDPIDLGQNPTCSWNLERLDHKVPCSFSAHDIFDVSVTQFSEATNWLLEVAISAGSVFPPIDFVVRWREEHGQQLDCSTYSNRTPPRFSVLNGACNGDAADAVFSAL